MTIDEINIPQATSSDFQLVCKSTGKTYALAKEMLIGQEADCTIRLKAPQIRRYHAKLNKSEDGLFLEDLNAQNNTYLNGCRIGTGAWITLGDEINFDGIKFSLDVLDDSNEEVDDIFKIKLSDSSSIAKPSTSNKAHPAPDMPFSNQDVVEATRALEARAKERLQLYKAEESLLNPDWEAFIAKRQKEEHNPKKTTESAPAKVERITGKAAVTASSNIKTNNEQKKSVGAPHIAPENSEDEPRSITLPSIKVPIIDAANDIASDIIDEESATPKPIQADISKTTTNTTTISGELAQPANIEPAQNTPSKNTTPATNIGSGPRLVVQTAPIRGKCYVLAPTDAKTSWTIGRASNTDIQLSEDGIDLIHAHIELIEGEYKIRTTRTTNGMLINDKFKSESVLKENDNVQFGRMIFSYKSDIQVATSPKQETGNNKINYSILVGSLVVLGALLTALLQNTL